MLKPLFLCACLALGLVPSAATAGGSPFSLTSVADVSILPGWRTDRGTHVAALRVVLAPGWKTYWRAPGESGIPPRFDWQGSRNLGRVEFHWPTPEVFEQNGMRTVGYKHELILPIELTPDRPGQDITLRAEVELGVCQDICMPLTVRVAADLPPDAAPDPRIRAALDARPFTAAQAGLRGARCAVEPIADGLRITATLTLPHLGGGEIVVFEHPDQGIWVAEAQARRTGDALTAVTEMVPPTSRPFSLDRSSVRMTVLGGGRAVDVLGCTG